MDHKFLREFLEAEYGLKPIQQEPTLQDKVREALLNKMVGMAYQLGIVNNGITYLGTLFIKLLGVHLYGMLKLQVIADVVNEGWKPDWEDGNQEKCIPLFSHYTHTWKSYTQYRDLILGGFTFQTTDKFWKFIELANVKYFEGDITLEEMR